MKQIPTYNINIDLLDEETGCYTVSLVEFPAVEVDFLKFEKETPVELKFNDDKHIITGVALRADYPIYRNSPERGEYYVVFTKEIIRDIVEKYSKHGFNNLVNIEHNENNYVNNVIMIESYIIDRERGVNPIAFEKVEDGSWITSFKVNDLNVWSKIKNGEVKGFSVEGFFKLIENPKTDDSTISLEEDDFQSFINKLLED
jgi:hypothetical protein